MFHVVFELAVVADHSVGGYVNAVTKQVVLMAEVGRVHLVILPRSRIEVTICEKTLSKVSCFLAVHKFTNILVVVEAVFS